MTNLLIIPIFFGTSGLICLGIAFFLNSKFGYSKGGVKTTGTLVAFRWFGNFYDNLFEIWRNAWYEDCNYNKQNSKPVIVFIANGISVTQHTEWAVGGLSGEDIGKELPVVYYPARKGESYRVVVEGAKYERPRNFWLTFAFWGFAGMGIVLIIFAVLATLLFLSWLRYTGG